MRISSIIIALLILTVVTMSGCLSESEKPPVDPLEPRENSEAGIKITITYLPDISDATAFDIAVTAHKNYNDDFKNNSFLKDPDGKTYKPISYEGEGGHHASGTLRFQKIESKRFELVIQDVADVKERIFKW
ncbi:MAG: hypothetical protein PHH85_13615 [Candidatus Methanoperedens sp.]|nr:hypothetical protein [Candidatus Methanoperedens sp.]